MLIVPGAAGEIGVLARHAPLVAMLRAGSTRVHLGDGQIQEFATGPGFFQVLDDRVDPRRELHAPFARVLCTADLHAFSCAVRGRRILEAEHRTPTAHVLHDRLAELVTEAAHAAPDLAERDERSPLCAA